MHILIAHHIKIPAIKYGGSQRMMLHLGRSLVSLGHKVSFLVDQGSYCDFADVYFHDPEKKLEDQIPDGIDIIHFHYQPRLDEDFKIPYLVTQHGNEVYKEINHKNTVYVSKDHASRFGCEAYVHNGYDWDTYTKPDLRSDRKHYHFLGKAAWRLKNLKGAIQIVKNTQKEKLLVLGGHRLNIKMGFRLTVSSRVRFKGMVNDREKDHFLNQSKGLIFPVLWHEPFGLAIIESLYKGCPVFGTPYGSLPELVTNDVGFLSFKASEISEALDTPFDRKKCHEYAQDVFSAKKMTADYLNIYEKLYRGESLNRTLPSPKVETKKFLPWEN